MTDELSTPQARADRLRRLRHLANLSRKDMCDQELNINTLKAWELARFGGLPKDGAEKVIKRVAKEGVMCTSDWLLHGLGAGPQLDSERDLINQFRKLLHDMRTPIATINMGVATTSRIIDDLNQPDLSKLKILLSNSLEETERLNQLLDQFSIILKDRYHEH